jgi:hypothetical protein
MWNFLHSLFFLDFSTVIITYACQKQSHIKWWDTVVQQKSKWSYSSTQFLYRTHINEHYIYIT